MNNFEIIYKKIDNDNLKRILGKINKNEVKLDITCKRKQYSKVIFDLTLQDKLILNNPTLAAQLKINK